MPSTITHTYLSLDILNKLDNKPKNIINNNIEDYKTFAQGADIFYFYNIFLLKNNKVQDIGHKFHNHETNKVFKYIINYNKENKKDIIFAYLSGLVTHYIGDSIIHPYINYKANNSNKLKKTDKHFEIETYLDNYMVSKNYDNYNKFPNYKLQFNNKKNKDIIDLLNKLYKEFFNEDNFGIYYYKSLKSMRFVFKYFRLDRTGFKKQLYKLLDYNKLKVRRTKYLSYHFNLDNKEYYLNNNRDNWYNILDKENIYNDSFEDLYNKCIIKGSNIINKLYEYIYENKDIDLDKLLENKSYSTGLVIKK